MLEAELNRLLVRERVSRLMGEVESDRLARLAREARRGHVRGGVHVVTAALGEVRAARRRLIGETLALYVSVIGFGIVYGLAARAVGFTLVDLEAMNLLVFAGGSQLVAVGLLAAGSGWLPIVVVTAILNARHLPYGASLAPWFAGRPLRTRLLAAYTVVDESFALALAHFRRLGRFDPGGYGIVAVMLVIAWIASTFVGWAAAATLPPRLETSLRVAVPAMMAGLAMLLVVDRATFTAAVIAAAAGIAGAVVLGPAAGIAVGGMAGPLGAIALRADRPARAQIDRSPLPADRGVALVSSTTPAAAPTLGAR